MNTQRFLLDPPRYFAGAFQQFEAFGGPCVHFHRECLRAGDQEFLSDRHVEMLYATLTAWGMHRMGDVNKTKTKLTNWDRFRASIAKNEKTLSSIRAVPLLGSSERDYSEALSALWPCYQSLELSMSDATIVVNSKALFHLLPNLIPPIDRQYTVRFCQQRAQDWRDPKGKFKTVMLPSGLEAQFAMFRSVCAKLKHLADAVDPELLATELRENSVTAPKAIDNAIVNYVRIVSGGQIDAD